MGARSFVTPGWPVLQLIAYLSIQEFTDCLHCFCLSINSQAEACRFSRIVDFLTGLVTIHCAHLVHSPALE